MSKFNQHIAILGGGPCGLYAARVLSRQGFQVTVIDRGERPGGLATSHFHQGNWYDMGVHMFHAFDQEIFQDIKELMRDERIEVELNAKIRWAGNSYRYPLQFQDMIKGIPITTLCNQIFTLFGTQLKYTIFPKEPKDAEEALIQLYGKSLYKFFFEDFTHRYWGIHPRDLSATFITTKMPKLSAVDIIKKGLEKMGIKQKIKSVDSPLTQETLHYSCTGAETMTRCLAQAIIKEGGQVIQNAEVKKVITEKKKRVVAVEYEKDQQTYQIACDEYISTIPINTLIQTIDPECPQEISHAAKKLRYKPLAVYCLLVKKNRCLDALYVYYRDRVFHRIGEPKNAGLIVNPHNHTVLIVEMTCEYDDPKWRGDPTVKEQLLKDLVAEGICTPEEIVEIHVQREMAAYPVFSLGFETHLKVVKTFLQQFSNLQSTGRQGDFLYPNMHSAMRMGWKAADKIMEKQ